MNRRTTPCSTSGVRREATHSSSMRRAPRRIRYAHIGGLRLDGDVDLAALALESPEQGAAHGDQVVQTRIGGAIEERRDLGEGTSGGERELDLLAERRGRERPTHELVGGDIGGGTRDADATAVANAQVGACFLGNAGSLEPSPLEGHGCALHPAPQRVRASIRAAAGDLEQPLDHPGTSPPISASSIRTCGAPSVTGRGTCPALPHPPPIWFHRKSPAM